AVVRLDNSIDIHVQPAARVKPLRNTRLGHEPPIKIISKVAIILRSKIGVEVELVLDVSRRTLRRLIDLSVGSSTTRGYERGFPRVEAFDLNDLIRPVIIFDLKGENVASCIGDVYSIKHRPPSWSWRSGFRSGGRSPRDSRPWESSYFV